MRRFIAYLSGVIFFAFAQRAYAADSDGEGAPSAQAADAQAQPPTPRPVQTDPLLVTPEMRSRIGSDKVDSYPYPSGELRQSFGPVYQERKTDYRLRLFPPFYLEHTRYSLLPDNSPDMSSADRESLFGLLYYQRRSKARDADVIFPLAMRLRNERSHVLVLGPYVHRHEPEESDNWVVPLFFSGTRKTGGYFHSLPLLTTSHWNAEGAFTLVGPYFRSRTGSDVDLGVAPLFFHGHGGDGEGARRSYTLIPPLLYYHRENEVDESRVTVVGPVLSKTTPERHVTDVLPFFFHIEGRPETGGIRESHTTLFPFFHYGRKNDQSLFVLPGYLRRVTAKTDTFLTPFYSYATTRSGRTLLLLAGPLLPLYFSYTDLDTGLHKFAITPLVYHSSGPEGRDFLTPLFGRFETYGVSRTWWAFPSFVTSQTAHGWETDLHPLFYFGRNETRSHSVVAPLFWDFASGEGRTTIAFPFYWRFADTPSSSVVQIAGNTLYRQRRVKGGLDWDFHVLPLFSYGENPNGYFWNVLFGLAGYERKADAAHIKAFWLPIRVAGSSGAPE